MSSSNARTPQREHFPPTLPVERHNVRMVYLADPMTVPGFHTFTAGRFDAHQGKRPDVADMVNVSACGPHGESGVHFTPAMIVHMANTLLTENERSAILAPAIAGGHDE